MNTNLANNESLLIAKLAVIYIHIYAPTSLSFYYHLCKPSKGFMSIHDLKTTVPFPTQVAYECASSKNFLMVIYNPELKLHKPESYPRPSIEKHEYGICSPHTTLTVEERNELE